LVVGKHVIDNLENIFFEITHTNPGTSLGLEIWFDQQCMINQDNFDDHLKFHYKFQNKHQTHQLKIILKDKTSAHTVVDSNNQIISDTAIQIHDFKLNDISMIDTFFLLANYQSKELGVIPLVNCFGYIGFNGEVTFNFTSPVDLWVVNNYV
jgi:hypothetical protein